MDQKSGLSKSKAVSGEIAPYGVLLASPRSLVWATENWFNATPTSARRGMAKISNCMQLY